MSVISLSKDTDALTLTLVADFAAPTDRVWQLWSDPRQLEQWWGPPGYPATVQEHDLTAGGRVAYYMTSPEGERYHGYWQVEQADAPSALAFTDGFADDQGQPDPGKPTTDTRVTISDRDGGTRMELLSRFGSREQMDELVQMGMEEGLRAAVGQIDALLAA